MSPENRSKECFDLCHRVVLVFLQAMPQPLRKGLNLPGDLFGTLLREKMAAIRDHMTCHIHSNH